MTTKAMMAEYFKSCTCAPKDEPWECKECTLTFLRCLKEQFEKENDQGPK